MPRISKSEIQDRERRAKEAARGRRRYAAAKQAKVATANELAALKARVEIPTTALPADQWKDPWDEINYWKQENAGLQNQVVSYKKRNEKLGGAYETIKKNRDLWVVAYEERKKEWAAAYEKLKENRDAWMAAGKRLEKENAELRTKSRAANGSSARTQNTHATTASKPC